MGCDRGLTRRINVGLATSEERRAWNPKSPGDPDVLPGARDYAAPENGFLWDFALAANINVRNYGCFIDDSRYGLPQDYAVGLLVERIARSPFWESTVIVVLEDDAQNGADHVSAQRSFVLFAGGHVKTGGAVVKTRYSTPSALRTIELLLGIGPMAITDAFAPPIAEAFSTDVAPHDFTATVPAVLRSTKLPVPPGDVMQPRGTATEWATAMEGMDFDEADDLPTDTFNAALYCGLIERTSCQSSSGPTMRPATALAATTSGDAK